MGNCTSANISNLDRGAKYLGDTISCEINIASAFLVLQAVAEVENRVARLENALSHSEGRPRPELSVKLEYREKNNDPERCMQVMGTQNQSGQPLERLFPFENFSSPQNKLVSTCLDATFDDSSQVEFRRALVAFQICNVQLLVFFYSSSILLTPDGR